MTAPGGAGPAPAGPVVVAADVGAGSVRVRVLPHGPARDHPAGAGLGDPDGAGGADAVVRAAVATPPVPTGRPWRLAVGLPGVLGHPDRAVELAEMLTRGWPVNPEEVLVASDVVARHAGALDGHDGVVLSVGTGAVALGRRAGDLRRVDGRGLLLGDEGGGAWIGLAGLRAAARASEGAGPATALRRAAHERHGDPSTWHGLDRPAAVAAFAPAVLDAAEHGDAVAVGIVEAAADALTRTVEAAGGAVLPVVVVGGLAARLGPILIGHRPDIGWREPEGDAADGLALLALGRSGPFEPDLVRRRPAPPPRVPSAPPAVAREVDALPTEAVQPGSEALDTLPTAALVERLVQGQALAVPAVAATSPALVAAVDRVATALGRGGRLVYVGAGTPGRLALQDAAELVPTFGLDPRRTPVLLAGGGDAAERPVEGAEDDTAAGAAGVAHLRVGPDDVVVGVTASGRTPFVVAALAAARERGAAAIAVVCAGSSPAAAAADVAVELLTGPEVLSGSTRLAAGTAQKVVLNTLSTAAMVRSGHTFGPWMVGVRATNAKLRRRAVRIVRDAAGVTDEVADAALVAAGGEVSTALVCLLADVDVPTARARLSRNGSVRAALGRDGEPGPPAAGSTVHPAEGRAGSDGHDDGADTADRDAVR